MLPFNAWNLPTFSAAVADRVPVVVTSSSLCPNPKDIELEASQLGASMRPELTAINVVVEGNAMRVRFIQRAATSEQSVAERMLPLPEKCTERVALAAVAIASWLGQVNADLPALPLPPAVPFAQVDVAREPIAQVVATSLPTWQLGLGVMVTSADSWSGGLRGEISRATPEQPLSWGMAAAVGLPHSANIGSGVSRWTRATLLFGPRWTIKAGNVLIGGEVTAGMTALWAQGEGYPRSQSDFALVPTGSLGARFACNGAPSWWLDTRIVISKPSGIHAWSQELLQDEDLARTDVQISLGATLDLFSPSRL